ncbi:unnamed protein product (macronuclear) [Paramecium tetraurelia]|uniref:Anaphase-promoting complex subunit 4 WD40 domain-containing protein n=1 Tax=Paramecium tetraurelia TaxID=5888 RepID=A0DAE6_PARTE|nr:uncharacterized protein GSPATT00014920001 [Paramecium tetraurelia]CAK80013.1 unnamed protein product [Paramecium tetraurelia]|eukprot:XP_001447410.1 hypothetical protein (macronuclear) [Paramecium tetraurelia strain d4-2]
MKDIQELFHLREYLEIPQLTYISRDSSDNLVAVGDSQGNLMILDLIKKIRIAKKETNGKRILKVCLSDREQATDEYKNVCAIGVIHHNDATVYIYRYRVNENRIQLHHTITMSKDKNYIGEYPVDINISQYCQYISIAQYNGCIKVFRIPDIKVDNLQSLNQVPNNNSHNEPQSPMQNQSKMSGRLREFQQIGTQQQQQHIGIQNSPLDVQCTELTDLVYQVKFRGVKKQLNYNGILEKMKTENIKESQVEEKVDLKKKSVVPNKKPIETSQVVEEILYDDNSNFMISDEDYPEQKFKALVEFVKERLNFQSGNKTFNAYKQQDCVTGIVVGWTNTTILEIHKFANPCKSALPEYLNTQQIQTIIQQKVKQQIIEIQILYPLSSLAISKNSINLGVGLKQGSVLVYDLIMEQEKGYLDKHVYSCTFMKFCEDNRLVSASYDGSVNIYDTQECKVLCKRTHQFRKGTRMKIEEQKQGLWRIIGMSVSNTGMAVALDAQQEVRIYDVWHGEKIAKLSPQQVMDEKSRQWVLEQPIVACFKNEILVSASNKLDQTKQTTLQIFKIFDNLVNLFPGLANIYRKGVSKDKIMNLFQRINKFELQNTSFEIPNLQCPPSNQQVKITGQENKASFQRPGSIHISNRSNKLNKLPPTINQNGRQSRAISLINSLQKSNQSEQQVDFNSSFQSNMPSSFTNRQQKQTSKQIVLTKEILHPEQFLLEKEKIQIPFLVKEELEMVQNCRNRNYEKLARIEKVSTMIQQVGQKLALEEEKRKLQKRYRQLSVAK